jgi:hypothetical protein
MQAFARNCRNQLPDAKREAQAAHHRQARVPTQEVGADRPVIVMEALWLGWSEGVGSGGSILRNDWRQDDLDDTTGRPFRIDKRRVYEAYKAVGSSKRGAGVDGQTIVAFEADMKEQHELGKPPSPPVRAVSIPKKRGEQILAGPLPSPRHSGDDGKVYRRH